MNSKNLMFLLLFSLILNAIPDECSDYNVNIVKFYVPEEICYPDVPRSLGVDIQNLSPSTGPYSGKATFWVHHEILNASATVVLDEAWITGMQFNYQETLFTSMPTNKAITGPGNYSYRVTITDPSKTNCIFKITAKTFVVNNQAKPSLSTNSVQFLKVTEGQYLSETKAVQLTNTGDCDLTILSVKSGSEWLSASINPKTILHNKSATITLSTIENELTKLSIGNNTSSVSIQTNVGAITIGCSIDYSLKPCNGTIDVNPVTFTPNTFVIPATSSSITLWLEGTFNFNLPQCPNCIVTSSVLSCNGKSNTKSGEGTNSMQCTFSSPGTYNVDFAVYHEGCTGETENPKHCQPQTITITKEIPNGSVSISSFSVQPPQPIPQGSTEAPVSVSWNVTASGTTGCGAQTINLKRKNTATQEIATIGTNLPLIGNQSFNTPVGNYEFTLEAIQNVGCTNTGLVTSSPQSVMVTKESIDWSGKISIDSIYALENYSDDKFSKGFQIKSFITNKSSSILSGYSITTSLEGITNTAITSIAQYPPLRYGVNEIMAAKIINIPQPFENKQLKIELSLNGSVLATYYKTISFWYIAKSNKPFSFEMDTYKFDNITSKDYNVKAVLSELSKSYPWKSFISSPNGYCFGMAASCGNYYLNDMAKPACCRYQPTTNLYNTNADVIKNIILYQTEQVSSIWCSTDHSQLSDCFNIIKTSLLGNNPIILQQKHDCFNLLNTKIHALLAYKMLYIIEDNIAQVIHYDCNLPNNVPNPAIMNIKLNKYGYNDYDLLDVISLPNMILDNISPLSIGNLNISTFLYNNSYTLFSFHCPVHITFSNDSGLISGFKNDFFVNQIPGASIAAIEEDSIKHDTTYTFLMPSTGRYHLTYSGTNLGVLSVAILKTIDKSTLYQIAYDSIPLFKSSHGNLSINFDTIYSDSGKKFIGNVTIYNQQPVQIKDFREQNTSSLNSFSANQSVLYNIRGQKIYVRNLKKGQQLAKGQYIAVFINQNTKYIQKLIIH